MARTPKANVAAQDPSQHLFFDSTRAETNGLPTALRSGLQKFSNACAKAGFAGLTGLNPYQFSTTGMFEGYSLEHPENGEVILTFTLRCKASPTRMLQIADAVRYMDGNEQPSDAME
jgi:hypothetical protein